MVGSDENDESGESGESGERERRVCVCVNILYIVCVYTKPTTSDKFNKQRSTRWKGWKRLGDIRVNTVQL